MNQLPRSFYLQDTITVAKALLGCRLVHQLGKEKIVGRIIETEAYIGPVDKACHAYNFKRTRRTETLFAIGGTAYVYFIYGMYHCMNVVSEAENIPCAVLLRSLEILEGLDEASRRRFQQDYAKLTKAQRKNMSNGPGKLCLAMGINLELNREDLLGERLYITEGETIPEAWITAGKRVGIDYAEEAKDFLWRYTLTPPEVLS